MTGTVTRKRIVALGGGFTGCLSAALELNPKRQRVTLVDQRRWF